jgi:hypothetical protein
VPTPSSLNQSVRCPKQRPHLHCSLLPFLFPPRLRPRRVEATARALPNLRVTPVTVVRERALPNLQVTPVTVVRARALPNLRVTPATVVRERVLPNLQVTPATVVRERALPNLQVTPVTVVRERALPNLQVTPVTVVRERALPSLRVKRVLRITQAFEKPRRAAMRRYRIEAWQLLSLWATRKMFASEFSLGGATNVLHRMLGRRHSCTH